MERLTAIRRCMSRMRWRLSEYLKMPLPLWVAEPRKKDYVEDGGEPAIGHGVERCWAMRVSHVSDQADRRCICSR